jgi:cytochrome d ubiquinol oxidase subunit I
VSAWYLLRNKHTELAKSSIRVALPVFVIFSILQVPLFGGEQAVAVADYQQPKLAAMEGLWETQSCAPLYIVGWVNVEEQKTTGISIPCLLSFLSYGSIDAPVKGLTEFSPDVWAPINLVFQVYHIMINLGFLFIPMSLVAALYFFWGRRLWTTRWVLWLLVVSIFLTELATQTGWWTAEFGRQPWIVWNVLRTADADSPVLEANQVAFSLFMFVVLYSVLLALFIYLLNEKIQHGPDPLEEDVQVESLPDTFRDIFGRRVQM